MSKDISLLDQKGSEVLLGETLMVPIANSMVYLRPLYVSPTTNPQPQLQYVVAVLGKNVQIDTSLNAVLSDLLQTTVTLPTGTGVPSTGTVPAAVAGILQAAQTDYNNALAALKADNLTPVPAGPPDDGPADQRGPAGARDGGARLDADHDDDHHGAADQGQVDQDDDVVDELYDVVDHHDGADQHRAQGRRHDLVDVDVDDTGVGVGPRVGLRRGGRASRAGPRGRFCGAAGHGCGAGLLVP